MTNSARVELPPSLPSHTVTTMSYNAALQAEARYIRNFGPSATVDKFWGAYNALLMHWFPSGSGYIVGVHALTPGGIPRYLMARYGDRPDLNPILILVLKSPRNWTAVGRQTVMDELAGQIKRGFDHTQCNTIYGLGAIGLHWMVCKMTSNDDQPTLVLDWQDDIITDGSYSKFEEVADLVYNLASG
jgi:hypothetical protein